MPAKNALKIYVENSYYHLYNRGVEKKDIFLDEQDYKTFLSYLKLYLTPPPPDKPLQNINNHAEQIDLLAYCLIPNHFHLLVKQNSKDSINYFMRSLATKYAVYFNKKCKRVGPLFQGRYKAVRVETDDQLLYLTKYIHRNPIELNTIGTDPFKYQYSSYRNYLKIINQSWIKPEEIMAFFSSINPKISYQAFVETTEVDPTIINNLIIE